MNCGKTVFKSPPSLMSAVTLFQDYDALKETNDHERSYVMRPLLPWKGTYPTLFMSA